VIPFDATWWLLVATVAVLALLRPIFVAIYYLAMYGYFRVTYAYLRRRLARQERNIDRMGSLIAELRAAQPKDAA
jgi:hypothetical protein